MRGAAAAAVASRRYCRSTLAGVDLHIPNIERSGKQTGALPGIVCAAAQAGFSHLHEMSCSAGRPNGLSRKSSMPASRQRFLSSAMALAVIAMIGTCLESGRRMRRVVS